VFAADYVAHDWRVAMATLTGAVASFPPGLYHQTRLQQLRSYVVDGLRSTKESLSAGCKVTGNCV